MGRELAAMSAGGGTIGVTGVGGDFVRSGWGKLSAAGRHALLQCGDVNRKAPACQSMDGLWRWSQG